MKDTPFLELGKEYPLLSKAEEIRLSQIIESGSGFRKKDAVDKLVNSNVRLVSKLLNKYKHLEIDLDDLFAEGLYGLCIASEKFDWRKGNRFGTFAYYWIRHKMHRFVEQNLNIIKIPVHVQDTLKVYYSSYEKLLNIHNVEPSFEMILEDSGLNGSKLSKALKFGVFNVNSINGSIDGNEIEYEDDKMKNLLEDIELEVAIENVKKNLNNDQCYVLECLLLNLSEDEIVMDMGRFNEIKLTLEGVVIDLLWGGNNGKYK